MHDENDKQKVIYPELSYKIIGSLFDVYNNLGPGYQERYYYKAIEKSLKDNGLKYKSQVPIEIKFRDEKIGKYFLYFLIEDKIVLEVKKGNYFSKKNFEQVYAYLKATNIKLGILVNFTSTNIKFYRVLNIT